MDAGIILYDYATTIECVDKDNIIIMVYSIGTGVATYVASQREITGLVLMAPYDDFSSIANGIMNIKKKTIRFNEAYKKGDII